MEELALKGKQEFMGKEIPVVLGGFGEGKKCVSDKTIAEIHGMEVWNVRARITDNIKRFKQDVDYIDLKQRLCLVKTLEEEEYYTSLLVDLGYAKQSVTQAEHIYILSERGYAKLVKIMDTDLAWEIHDKLIDEYFDLRDSQQKVSELSPQLQLLINMELKQKEQDEKLEQLGNKVDSIKDIVALNPNDWRKDSFKLINEMALSLGGYELVKDIRSESYQYLDERMAVSLNKRLTNKRRRMADEGICKSKRDKLNQLDVIADDKKLIEGYIAIIKEMAVKYGVAGQGA